MRKKTMIIWGLVLLLLLSAPAAWARLVAIGPISPDNGFPLYYVDSNGNSVWLPPPSLGGPFFQGTNISGRKAITPPSMLFIAPDPTNPFSVQIGFDQEFDYWACQEVGTALDGPGHNLVTPFGTFTFQCNMEASFAINPVTINGNQTVLTKISCVLPVGTPALPSGTYTIQHPYGTETVPHTAGSKFNFFLTVPLNLKLDFTTVMTSPEGGPFLTQLSPPVVISGGTPATNSYNIAATWLGDGATKCTVTGSPVNQNFVRITAPAGVNLDGLGNNFVQSDLFIIGGQRYPFPIPTPATLNRVTYTRTHFTTYYDAFASSVTGATVSARVWSPTPIAMPGGTGPFAGLFFARAHYANSSTRSMQMNPTNPLAPVSVTSQFTGSLTSTTLTQKPVDQVIITQASWSAATQTLTVAAKSSDSVLRSPLSLVNPSFGALAGGTASFASPIAPAAVTVGSAAGGVATKAVQVLP